MKTILFLCSTLCLTAICAQTPLISHKSHSGTAINYFIDPNSNFGIDETTTYGEKTFEYVPLNDKQVVRNIKNVFNYPIQVDTLRKPKRMSYERFTEKDLKKIQKKLSKEESKANADREKAQRKQEKAEDVPVNFQKKRNTPSFLLIFFAVSALGMIVMRLFSRRTHVTN